MGVLKNYVLLYGIVKSLYGGVLWSLLFDIGIFGKYFEGSICAIHQTPGKEKKRNPGVCSAILI